MTQNFLQILRAIHELGEEATAFNIWNRTECTLRLSTVEANLHRMEMQGLVVSRVPPGQMAGDVKQYWSLTLRGEAAIEKEEE